MDIQPVFNHYMAITYMCAYLSKTEDECSRAMNQAAKKAYENNLDIYQQMRSVANAYSLNREVSVQEAVYLIMLELWLRKVFSGVQYANNNLPEKRYRMCLSEDEIKALPDDSTDIFKQNMIDRYVDRSNSLFANGKYAILDSFCFAEFLRYYCLAPKGIENDCQPEKLDDQVTEVIHADSGYPKLISLMSSPDKLKC